MWSRETGSAVPSRVSLLISIHTLAESGAYLRDSSRVPRRRGVHLYRHTPSDQSRVYLRVTQLRTDGVHCRESASTGPVNLKVINSKRVLPWQVRSPYIDQLTFASPSHTTPTIGIICSGHVESTGGYHINIPKTAVSLERSPLITGRYTFPFRPNVTMRRYTSRHIVSTARV